MNEAYVREEIQNGISTITFFHPAHNSLPGDILSELTHTITEAGNNDEVKVIILKSGGDRTFCAGASFKELISINDAETGRVFFAGFANVINAMRTCPKFIIGRVQGKAVGGGVGIASATDYCMATKYASIKLSELSIGIGPFVIEPAVERKVGLAAMSQLTIDASNFYNAEWAKQKGLYTNIYDTVEELDVAVQELAKNISTYNPMATREMKKILWKNTEDWDMLLAERAVISGRLVLSEFTNETLKRFK